MNILETKLAGVKILEPRRFGDERGFFMESYNRAVFDEMAGTPVCFVQDNHSRSSKGVLRGLHYQAAPRAQGKLGRVLQGAVLDVVVDIRRASPHFGHWFSVVLTAENQRQLWIPAGFAHGFYVLSDVADYFYKTTEYYSPSHERSVRWNDADLAIDWQLSGEPILSEKDRSAPRFDSAEYL